MLTDILDVHIDIVRLVTTITSYAVKASAFFFVSSYSRTDAAKHLFREMNVATADIASFDIIRIEVENVHVVIPMVKKDVLKDILPCLVPHFSGMIARFTPLHHVFGNQRFDFLEVHIV